MSLQLPKILELVGLGYTGWFVYRYLLFKVLRSFCKLVIQFVFSREKKLDVTCNSEPHMTSRPVIYIPVIVSCENFSVSMHESKLTKYWLL